MRTSRGEPTGPRFDVPLHLFSLLRCTRVLLPDVSHAALNNTVSGSLSRLFLSCSRTLFIFVVQFVGKPVSTYPPS